MFFIIPFVLIADAIIQSFAAAAVFVEVFAGEIAEVVAAAFVI